MISANHMKNQKGFASLVLIGALVVLVGVGGYLVFVRENCRKDSIDQYSCATLFSRLMSSSKKPVTSTPQEVSAVSNNDVSSWKTYTSSKYGIEFKYPANLKVEFYGTDAGGVIDRFEVFDPTFNFEDKIGQAR